MLIFAQPYTRSTPRLHITLTRGKDGSELLVQNLRNAEEILYRLAAVLHVHGWDILSADVLTLDDSNVQDRFLIRPPAEGHDDLAVESMMDDFEKLLSQDRSVADYLKASNKHGPLRPGGAHQGEVKTEAAGTLVTVTGPDRPGLFLALCRLFALMDLDVIEAHILTESDGTARNRFLVNPADKRFENPRFRERFLEALETSI